MYVYAAVDFAKENGIEISIKNSCHSYSDASTKAKTLLLDINHFREYSETGLIECNQEDELIELDLALSN
jgi:hypothetical protein